ncbi:DUF1893 domain-containing protein [Chloroflexota bacterium]
MNNATYEQFVSSTDTLRVYEDDVLVFCSSKERLLALLEYIEASASTHQGVVILDKVMGNAAALLAIKARCREVYSPLGSALAIETLDKYTIKHYIEQVVPYVQKDHQGEMCPMERLSIGKNPEEFYASMRSFAKRTADG